MRVRRVRFRRIERLGAVVDLYTQVLTTQRPTPYAAGSGPRYLLAATEGRPTYDRLLKEDGTIEPIEPFEATAKVEGSDAYRFASTAGYAPYDPLRIQTMLPDDDADHVVRSTFVNYDALRAVLPEKEAWRAQAHLLSRYD